jgi:uncharacterized metal-binding protein
MSLSFPLGSIIRGYHDKLHATDACTHQPSSYLDKEYNSKVLATRVASPRPVNSKVGFVMTQSNSVAQLRACDSSQRMLLLQGCCLNCAFQ